jgi:hypothetical protein
MNDELTLWSTENATRTLSVAVCTSSKHNGDEAACEGFVMKQFQYRQFQYVMICMLVGGLGVVLLLAVAAIRREFAGYVFSR